MQLILDKLARALDVQRPAALLVGGQALPTYGVVRQTLDVDRLAGPVGARQVAGRVGAGGSRLAGESSAVARFCAGSPKLADQDLLIVSEENYEKMVRESLELPVFEMPRAPGRRIPPLVWLELHAEFVRRLKASEDYERIQRSPSHTPAAVAFELRDGPCKS